MGPKSPRPPKMFYVNWVRRDANGKFLWPGFGENVRVLKWILERVEGSADAKETPIGYVPTENSLTLDGLSISQQKIDELLRVDAADWAAEEEDVAKFFRKFGSDLPDGLRKQEAQLGERLSRVATATR